MQEIDENISSSNFELLSDLSTYFHISKQDNLLNLHSTSNVFIVVCWNKYLPLAIEEG